MAGATSAVITAASPGHDPLQHEATLGIVAGVHAEPHVEIPMSQQSQLGSHGHDMHPQEFVRLAGCQDDGVRARQAADMHH